MPGKLKVRVVCGRGLPIMDKSTDLTDAFVEIRFRNETLKTEVCKKSLNPQWNSEWFKFEVEDEALQDEPLELRVLDHDTYSAHDAIGKVYVDLNPLLTKDMPNVISGWFPIYDTMHGIRGELNIIVKVELFSDVNKFRQSSCGIQFFSTTEVPYGYRLQIINGFVEELVVNDDPEYQWIDKIRTPRASNEARQRLFSKLSGELQRKIGVKVSDLGGNSVIGYFQCFDLEGESGIVVRGIGTAVNLTRPTLQLPPSPLGISPQLKDLRHAVSSLHQHHHQHHHHHHITRSYHHITMTPPNTPGKPTPPISPPPSAPPLSTGQSAFNFPFSSPVPEETALPSSPPNILRSSTSPVKCSAPIGVQRRSSESDLSNTTPPRGERSSLTGSSGSGSGSGTCTSKTIPKLSAQQPSIELMEYPFFTMTSFPAGFIVHLGGVVSAKSVKLLDRIHNPDEPETRDAWWTEIRNEIRSHMRSMGCHAVLGYTEQTTISDEIIVLSATGTAARVNLTYDPTNPRTCIQPLAVVSDKLQTDKEKKLFVDVNLANSAAPFKLNAVFDSVELNSPSLNCSLCHVPYKTETTPFPVNLSVCAICRRRKVPDVLFTTIDPPVEIHTYGKGSLIQARVCRTRIKSKSAETNAKEISDGLPFLEYELHSQLMNKLRLRGMNGLFGLKIQIAVSETVLVGIATATAVFFGALPSPPIPKVSGQVTSERENNELLELQKRITDTVQKNREKHDLHNVDAGQMSPRSVITDDSDDDISDLEVSFGNKEVYVIEVDDANDKSIISLLNDSVMPDGFTLFNTKKMPDQGTTTLSCNLQMFSHVWRGEFNPVSASKQTVSDLFEVIIKKICYKLRKMSPCSLCSLDFDIDLPEENELQISLTGVCCGLEAVTESISDAVFESSTVNKNHLLKMMHNVSNISGQSEGEDMMFHMEEVSSETNTGHHPGTQSSHVNHSGDQTSHVNNSGDQSLHAVSSGSQSSHGTSSISQSSHGTNPGNQSSHAVNSGSHSLHGTSSSSQSSHVTNPGNQSSHGTNPGNQSSHAVNSGSQSSHGTSSSSQLSHGTNPINLSSHGTNPGNQSSHGTNPGNQSSHAKQQPKLNRSETKKFHHPSSKPRHWVEITPLSFVPGTKVERYLGNYNFFFIRETTSLREMGGLSGFMQAFIAEVLCNVRANVSALGGNGLVTYRMSQCVLLCNPHKNQSQCLINVSGDAVVLGVEEETIIVEPVRKNSTSPLPTHTS